MERKYKLTIPEPCTENWDEMTPKENGRFCLSCSKTVVDFTAMLPDEVQHFFIENQNNKVCGRFKKSQLDTITIQIPSRILYTQTHYHKLFLLALFIAMGTTLFSCKDENGNKQKIEKVQVVQDDAPVEHITVGETTSKSKNSDGAFLLPPPPPPKVDHVKFVKPVSVNSNKTIKDKKQSSKQVKEDDSQFVTDAVLQTNAEFPGGIDPFYTFFGNEFKKPENINTKNLKIRISFAVEKNGSLSYIESIPAIDKTVEQEIIRVLSLSPKWQPGESNGKKIRIQYSLPIVLE
ncbi:hypothetical protein [Flavobacterium sp. Root420]|uniref:hypothetical protein n=1 Tax=Flavobacterium sp. Root420 TaxID=1736533 RepID=UPI0006FFD18F|nr:hypothetical protein [Flavobacterium sp. Root420]KQX09040.1 hypothetical protein ASC72_05715 [Flavobacterium sp. Root420]